MSVVIGAPTPSPKKRKGRKPKGPVIEIEELWQPNEEQKKVLLEKIDWRAVIRNLMKSECSSEKAYHAMVNLKDLVGIDAFADKMMEPGMIELGSAELYTKIAKHTIRPVYR